MANIHHDLVDVLVLPRGTPGGYAELDRRWAGEIEAAYLDLFPNAIRQGTWGRPFTG
jgi:hypothetical protein